MKLSILGSGIAALSAAQAAVLAGIDVQVYTKNRPGAATPAAAGMLTPSFEASGAEQTLISLAVESLRLYPKWIEGIVAETGCHIDYRSCGALMMALHHDHLAELSQLEQFQQKLGLSTQRLSKSAVQDLEPAISPKQVGGLFAQSEQLINPSDLHKALQTQLEHNQKACFIPYSQAFLSERDNNRAELIVDGTNVTSDQILIADGAWSKMFLSELPLRPVKGQYLLLKGEELLSRTIRTPDVYIVPRNEGLYYIGATMEEEGFSLSRTAGGALDLLYHAWQIFRGVYELDLIHHGVGLRPALRDNLPAIGSYKYSNLHLSIGYYRHGILLAPIAAQLLVKQLLSPSDTPFSPERFSQ